MSNATDWVGGLYSCTTEAYPCKIEVIIEVDICFKQKQANMAKRKRPSEKYDSSDGEEEYFGVCEKCGKDNQPGLLLLCDGCENSCHTFCCVPELLDVPKSDWFCTECRSGHRTDNKDRINYCIAQMWDCMQKSVSKILKYQPLQSTQIKSALEVSKQLLDNPLVDDPGPYEMLEILGLSRETLVKTSDMYGKLKLAKHSLFEALLTTHTIFKFGVFQEPLTNAVEISTFDMLLTDVCIKRDVRYHLYTLLSSKQMKEWDEYIMGPASESDETSSDEEGDDTYSALQLAVKYNTNQVDEEFQEVIADSQALVKRLQVNGEGLDRVIEEDNDFLVEVAKVKMIVEDSLPLVHRLKLSDANMAVLFLARAGSGERKEMSEEHIWCLETLKFFKDELGSQDWAQDVISSLREFCDKFASAS